MELCRLRPDDLPNHFSRNTQIAADRLDRHLSRKIRQTNFGDRLHNQHLGLGPLRDQEACVDPYPRGPDWMPITPKTGSLFHAESQRTEAALNDWLEKRCRELWAQTPHG